MPRPDRVCSGYYLDVLGRLLLFDCGGGVSASCRRHDVDWLNIEAVFISHAHSDHVSDLPLFVQMLYPTERRRPLAVYLPEETIEAVKRYFRALYLYPEKLPFEVSFLPVTGNKEIHLDPISILPIPNSHLLGNGEIIEQYRLENRMQSFSYLVRAGDKSLLYSADIGSEGDLKAHLAGLDLLVVESTHIDIADLIALAVDSKVKWILLTHIAEEVNLERVRLLAQKVGYGNLVIAEDGLKVEL